MWPDQADTQKQPSHQPYCVGRKEEEEGEWSLEIGNWKLKKSIDI